MTAFPRALRRFSLALPLALLTAAPLTAQSEAPAPSSLQTGEETPWIYEGSDVPRDEEWLFGEMDNGLRYAVRRNGVPPGQVSIRVRVDAGSLHERDSERGYAHLLEHMLFRESAYLGQAEAIPTWQRLGASFGSDTNASTSPTQTVYQLDLPNIDAAKLSESFKLLSGMVRAPVLSDANVAAEVPIVLAEKRQYGGAGQRVAITSRETLFAGQRLAERLPIGTEETLTAASGKSVQAFYDRWYRPENTVIVAAGDVDPLVLAQAIERWFGDWDGKGAPVAAPEFGDPVAPAGADPDFPVGEVAVLVEPDLPRQLVYAVMRPWRQQNDTIVYNEGKLRDQLATALINRRLEARARGGGSYLSASVQQADISRSANMTQVSVTPLTEDWRAALKDVRGVIADALQTPPTQEEIDRELAEFEVGFASMVEQQSVAAGSVLADTVVGAVDIRESVAAPETFLQVFNSMRGSLTPQLILEETRALFEGDVVRGLYITPESGEADEAAVRTALQAEVTADANARLAASAISFDELPPIGEKGDIVQIGRIGVLDIEQIEFANGVKVLLWANDGEPGRASVKVRFGAGYRAFDPEDAAYVTLGELALVQSGLGELGQEELDRISNGRRMGFQFGIEEGAFTFFAQTRQQDVADQLYLFAAKLAMPRWDDNPVLRGKAAAKITYESYGANPSGVLSRDLEYYLRDGDPRFAVPTPAMLDAATPEGFREVWEPILKQGPVEVLVFGEFDREATIDALRRTFGALPARESLSPEIANRAIAFPDPGETQVLRHRGDADQAAAVIAWPSGAGVADLRESRQLQILIDIFNDRLREAMRERAGAAYAPVVQNSWPTDVDTGGRITALAQLRPEDVDTFFAEADRIANELATAPVAADELQRVTEPLRQLLNRASTGNLFWLYQLEGATVDPRVIAMLPSMFRDYTETTPAQMQQLASKYFAGVEGWRLAVLPETTADSAAAPTGR